MNKVLNITQLSTLHFELKYSTYYYKPSILLILYVKVSELIFNILTLKDKFTDLHNDFISIYLGKVV